MIAGSERKEKRKSAKEKNFQRVPLTTQSIMGHDYEKEQ